jgi:hypothetical protein
MSELLSGAESFFGVADTRLGTPELQLPQHLQEPMREHLEDLHKRYLADGWGLRTGFGKRPAVVVVDLALFWTKPGSQMGSNLDPVVEATRSILDAARTAAVPIFFSTSELDPHQLPGLDNKRNKVPSRRRR